MGAPSHTHKCISANVVLQFSDNLGPPTPLRYGLHKSEIGTQDQGVLMKGRTDRRFRSIKLVNEKNADITRRCTNENSSTF